MEEVVESAGLGADAGHAEAAEGLAADECAGDAAVDVEIADAEVALGALEVGGLAGEDAAGELVRAGVGDLEGLVEAPGVDDRDDGAEDLLGRELVVARHVEEDVRRDERLAVLAIKTRGHRDGDGGEAGAAGARDEAFDLGFGLGVDDGADVGAGACGVADGQGLHGLAEAPPEERDGGTVGALRIHDDAA